jgi:hypothetical protein
MRRATGIDIFIVIKDASEIGALSKYATGSCAFLAKTPLPMTSLLKDTTTSGAFAQKRH